MSRPPPPRSRCFSLSQTKSLWPPDSGVPDPDLSVEGLTWQARGPVVFVCGTGGRWGQARARAPCPLVPSSLVCVFIGMACYEVCRVLTPVMFKNIWFHLCQSFFSLLKVDIFLLFLFSSSCFSQSQKSIEYSSAPPALLRVWPPNPLGGVRGQPTPNMLPRI